MNNFRRRFGKTRTITRTEIVLPWVWDHGWDDSGASPVNIINGGPGILTELGSTNLIVDVVCWFKCCLRTYYSDGSFEDSPEVTVNETVRVDYFYIHHFVDDAIESDGNIVNTPYGDVALYINTNGVLNDNGTATLSIYLHGSHINDIGVSYQKVADVRYSVSFYLI